MERARAFEEKPLEREETDTFLFRREAFREGEDPSLRSIDSCRRGRWRGEREWLDRKGEIVFVSETAYPPFELVDGEGSLVYANLPFGGAMRKS